MYALTKFGDVPNHLDGEMQYERVVDRLRHEGLLDEARVTRYGDRKYSGFIGVLGLILTFALIEMVAASLFPIRWIPTVFHPVSPYDFSLVLWGGFFVAGLVAHFARNPAQDRLVYLYNFGIPAPGTLDVLRLELNTRATCYSLGYHFAGPRGERCKGRMRVFERDLSPLEKKNLLEDQTEIVVLYHPECPALNVVWFENGEAAFGLRRDPLRLPPCDPTV